MKRIFFDVKEIYYLPQYLPIFKELNLQKNYTSKFIFYRSEFDDIINDIIVKENLAFHWIKNKNEALKYYLKEKPNWIFFGDSFSGTNKINLVTKTVQIGHGIGPKKVYYNQSKTSTTVRFVESQYRMNRLKEMFPKEKFVNVGYSKLDPLITDKKTEFSLEYLKLNSSKKTILYAPTFYPSSIERFSRNFPDDFRDYNIIIKPHYFSLSKKKYIKHKELLNHWKSFGNVFLADMQYFSIIPFLKLSDIMISDASSAMIEFAALKKPVIWCTFFKLRWNYKGIFKYRFKNRMDKDYNAYKNFTIEAKNYNTMIEKTKINLKNKFIITKNSEKNIEKYVGILDGKASKRIVTFLEEYN